MNIYTKFRVSSFSPLGCAYTFVIYLGRHIESKMETYSRFGFFSLYLSILINIYAKFGISSFSTLGCVYIPSIFTF